MTIVHTDTHRAKVFKFIILVSVSELRQRFNVK
jgi:hypothetical protein